MSVPDVDRTPPLAVCWK